MNNNLTLIGYVGNAPETKSFAGSDNKLVKFSIAVRDSASRTVERKPLWIGVEAWNGNGDKVLATITKGREVALSGRLAISSYTRTGDNGEVMQVTKPVLKLASFHLCGKKPS
jgi:single-stranded DNA-binding protein